MRRAVFHRPTKTRGMFRIKKTDPSATAKQRCQLMVELTPQIKPIVPQNVPPLSPRTIFTKSTAAQGEMQHRVAERRPQKRHYLYAAYSGAFRFSYFPRGEVGNERPKIGPPGCRKKRPT